MTTSATAEPRSEYTPQISLGTCKEGKGGGAITSVASAQTMFGGDETSFPVWDEMTREPINDLEGWTEKTYVYGG